MTFSSVWQYTWMSASPLQLCHSATQTGGWVVGRWHFFSEGQAQSTPRPYFMDGQCSVEKVTEERSEAVAVQEKHLKSVSQRTPWSWVRLGPKLGLQTQGRKPLIHSSYLMPNPLKPKSKRAGASWHQNLGVPVHKFPKFHKILSLLNYISYERQGNFQTAT